jgi:hypothetical protein
LAALNFKIEFEPAIMADLKRHTIRAERKDGRRPKPGEVLSLYVGMRTRQCRLLKRRRCAKVQDIRIFDTGEGCLFIAIEGVFLSESEKQQLARSDGFKDLDAMFSFWLKTHSDPLGQIDFNGAMIHWESDAEHRRKPDPPPARKHRPETGALPRRRSPRTPRAITTHQPISDRN